MTMVIIRTQSFFICTVLGPWGINSDINTPIISLQNNFYPGWYYNLQSRKKYCFLYQLAFSQAPSTSIRRSNYAISQFYSTRQYNHSKVGWFVDWLVHSFIDFFYFCLHVRLFSTKVLGTVMT